MTPYADGTRLRPFTRSGAGLGGVGSISATILARAPSSARRCWPRCTASVNSAGGGDARTAANIAELIESLDRIAAAELRLAILPPNMRTKPHKG